MSERTGEALRDEGIQRAADHAERVYPNWTAHAYAALEDFLTIGKYAHGATFTSEDVREHAATLKLPEPPNNRAWGAVFKKAGSSGLLTKRGTTTARAPGVHCSIITVWRIARPLCWRKAE